METLTIRFKGDCTFKGLGWPFAIDTAPALSKAQRSPLYSIRPWQATFGVNGRRAKTTIMSWNNVCMVSL